MKTTPAFGFLRTSPLAFAALALLAMAPLPASAEDTDAEMGPQAFTVSVPEGKLSLKQIHDAVIRTAIGREWNVKEDGETKVVIYLLHRKNEATVTFLITEKAVEAYCVGYVVDKAGNRKKPEQPSGWLSNLKKDLTKLINEAVLTSPR